MRTVLVQTPLLKQTAQAENIGRGLGDIHIHRIQLLDGRQGDRLSGCDQRAFRHARLSDAARNRRGDGRVFKIDAGGFHGRLAVLDVCLNLLEGGGGVVVILLADCAFGPKLLEAFFLELDGGQLRFGAGKRGFRVFKGRLVQGGNRSEKAPGRL
jgi:hypothetical protein